MAVLEVPALMGAGPVGVLAGTRNDVRVEVAEDHQRQAYRRLRRAAFVLEQGLFDDDHDEVDDDPRTLSLVALSAAGTVLGGVRLAPVLPGRDLGWWQGSRLVVTPEARRTSGVAAALVRAACARAEASGALRFEAAVQPRHARLFDRLGWQRVGGTQVAGQAHLRMRWPIGRLRAAAGVKTGLAALLAPDHHGEQPPGGRGFAGDDGAPVPGSDLVAACDAVLPSMVERDPEWAGWCAVLVNLNDLTAMGAEPVGLLDALAARDLASAQQVMTGLRAAARAWDVPLLGGHTQLGAHASLSVTALGRAEHPVPGGGGRPGHELSLTVDLAGHWRPGYRGRQWDSTSRRSPTELRGLARTVAQARPAAAKDVSMAGLVGTAGMLAEASGCGAVLDVADVPTPEAAGTADWFTCFPGFAMLTADPPGAGRMRSPVATTSGVGQLVPGRGVSLRWPDGELTEALDGAVTGLGRA